MSHPVDYIVKRVFEPAIIEDADKLRRALGQDYQLSVSPLRALKWFQSAPVPNKGLLTITKFNASAGNPPARVKYNPLRLFIDAERLYEAEAYSEPSANEIIAHEIGHILLHDQTAKAFSAADSKRLPSIQKETSAEWQADRFCDHYLLPIKLVEALGLDVHKIVNQCNVSRELAERQIANAQRLLKIRNFG